MADPKQLALLRQGVEEWNRWRKENPELIPDSAGSSAAIDFLQRTPPHPAFAGRINAGLVVADLTGADLRNADLNSAVLIGANLTLAGLSGTEFGHSELAWTIFGNVDLSQSKGLDQARHLGPSTIGIDTIYKSKGQIPEQFLRGAGVPDDFITYAKSLISNPIEFYSCFISYSSHDQAFLERLHADLIAKGLPCWYAP